MDGKLNKLRMWQSVVKVERIIEINIYLAAACIRLSEVPIPQQSQLDHHLLNYSILLLLQQNLPI